MVRALPSKKTARCYSVFGIRVVVDAGLGTLLVTDRSRGAVSGSTTATGLGKAMTSRMVSAPARMDTVRSQPRAMPA